METFGIGELARRTGVRPSAIRYYESLGLLTAPPRTGAWRRYDANAVEHLEVIRMARGMSFSIDEIQTLLNGFSPETPPPERWRQLAREKLPQLDALISHASAMKRLLEVGLSCRCVRIEDCFVHDCAGVGTDGGNGVKLVPLQPRPASVLRAPGVARTEAERA
jgi:MerR family redox-sensitive transcriptional activator SoxR